MASNYKKQTWITYDEKLTASEQPHSFLTKVKLDHMEDGIELANYDLTIGEVKIGAPGASIVVDTEKGVKILNLSIPEGPVGETGPAGPQGEKGEKGDKGDQGIQGIQGPAGPQGIQGPKGDKGDTGEMGPAGVQGPQGEKGDKGDQGLQGPKGDNLSFDDLTEEQIAAITGPEGPQGPQGEPGTQVELRTFDGVIQWKYTTDINWNDLIRIDQISELNPNVLDTTLSISGKAADAKAVGDAIPTSVSQLANDAGYINSIIDYTDTTGTSFLTCKDGLYNVINPCILETMNPTTGEISETEIRGLVRVDEESEFVKIYVYELGCSLVYNITTENWI